MIEKLHSFGGSALDRHVFDFETVIDATETEVAAGLETAPAGDPAPDPAASAPAGEAGPPSPEPDSPAGPPQIDWDDPSVASAVDARVQASIERMVADAQAAEAAANQPASQAPEPPDPFSENYDAELAAYIQWQVQQATAGITPVVEAAQAREAQEWTNQQLDTLGIPTADAEGELADGDVNTRDAVLYYAGGIQQAAAEAGLNVDGATILQHAWKQLQTRDQRIGKAAVETYKAELEGVAGAPRDPSGATGAGDGLLDADDELAVARLLAERRSQ
jgi:hypothetical protein